MPDRLDGFCTAARNISLSLINILNKKIMVYSWVYVRESSLIEDQDRLSFEHFRKRRILGCGLGLALFRSNGGNVNKAFDVGIIITSIGDNKSECATRSTGPPMRSIARFTVATSSAIEWRGSSTVSGLVNVKSGPPAWKQHPTWYEVSEDDHVIPPTVERMFAKQMNATTIALPSSHALLVSLPTEIAQLMLI
jgi:hypothetical protein